MNPVIFAWVATTQDVVTGQSKCNERALGRLANAGFIIENGFRRWGSDTNLRMKIASRLRLFGRGFIWFAKLPRGAVVYLVPPHGLGVLYVAPLVMVGRARRFRFVFHHHATNYLTERSMAHALLFRAAGRGTVHIVLCRCMRDGLSRLYASCRDVHVLSNALFFSESAGRQVETARRMGEPVRLGFLSNIWPAKGIFEFLDLAAALRERGVPCEAVVAGPILPGADADRIRERLETTTNVRYLGPIYDEEKKADFYRGIDVFVFPTKYRTEAEPLVLYEAFAAGVPVITTDRGCIREQVVGRSGVVIPMGEPFVDRALEVIVGWKHDAAAYAEACAEATRALDRKHSEAQAQWTHLLGRLRQLCEEHDN